MNYFVMVALNFINILLSSYAISLMTNNGVLGIGWFVGVFVVIYLLEGRNDNDEDGLT